MWIVAGYTVSIASHFLHIYLGEIAGAGENLGMA
jgi:hypothetical protein